MALQVLSVALTWEVYMKQPGETHICALKVQRQPILPNHLPISGINTLRISIILHDITLAASIHSSTLGERAHYGSHFLFVICISRLLTNQNTLFFSPMLILCQIACCWARSKQPHDVEWMFRYLCLGSQIT